MNPFAQRENPKGWVVPASVVSLLVGLMISAAFFTEGSKRRTIAKLPPDLRQQAEAGELNLAQEVVQLRDEVTKLREDKTKLEETIAKSGNASKAINESLQETKAFAGLMEMVGPGLILTLTDSKKPADELLLLDNGIIHYLDVLKSVNELFNAGAEAVSVNGRRVGPRTDFRCVGTTILVDAQKIAPPIVIHALGDNKTLLGAMNLPGGVLTELREIDPGMVVIEPAEELRVPAFDGSTTFKFSKAAEAKK
jgi:uncharacterized protein YlxW (UPF0749 family)